MTTTTLADHESTFGNVRVLFFETTGTKDVPADWRDLMDAGGRSWSVQLRFYSRRMTIDYYTGGAIERGHMKALDVLESLFMDATSYDDAPDFETWAGDLGYDTDSRQAEATYKACGRNGDKLKKFLGDQFEAMRARVEEAANA